MAGRAAYAIMGDSHAHHHPSAMRNRGPILEALRKVLPAELPASAEALEIGSGSGCHLELFAEQLKDLRWQPSEFIPGTTADVGKIGAARSFDGDSDRTLSLIDTYGCKRSPNVLPAIALDASAEAWPEAVTAKTGAFELVYCSNVTHISPWEVTRGIMAGGAALLHAKGRLVVYGPFKRGGSFTTESNRSFDESLRQRNPAWGYRDVESEVVPAAEACGLVLLECVEMPANNFILAFGKSEAR